MESIGKAERAIGPAPEFHEPDKMLAAQSLIERAALIVGLIGVDERLDYVLALPDRAREGLADFAHDCEREMLKTPGEISERLRDLADLVEAGNAENLKLTVGVIREIACGSLGKNRDHSCMIFNYEETRVRSRAA